MNFFEILYQWIEENPGKTAGAIVGFVLGLLILIFGPLKTLFIIILVALGFMIGKIRDDKISVSDQLRKMIRRNRE